MKHGSTIWREASFKKDVCIQQGKPVHAPPCLSGIVIFWRRFRAERSGLLVIKEGAVITRDRIPKSSQVMGVFHMLRLRKRQSKPSLGGQTHYHTIGWLRGWVPLSLLLGIPVRELPFRNVHCRVISCESMSSRQSRSCVRRSLRRLPYLRKSHSSSGAEVQARNILIRSFSHIFESAGAATSKAFPLVRPQTKS